MLPIVAGTLVNDSVSWPEAQFAVIDTVAEGSVVLSRSATVIAVLIALAAPFSVYSSVEPAASASATFADVTLIAEATVFEPAAPSFTVTLTLRAALVGLSALFA